MACPSAANSLAHELVEFASLLAAGSGKPGFNEPLARGLAALGSGRARAGHTHRAGRHRANEIQLGGLFGVLSESSISLTLELGNGAGRSSWSDLDSAMAALSRVPEHNEAAMMIGH